MTVNYEQIENYLHNGLTEAEHTAFEAEMAADPILADAVNLYRDIEAKMQGSLSATAREAALRQQLETLNQQYFGRKGGATVMQMQPEAHSGLDTGKAAATAVQAPVVAMRRRRMLYYLASAAAVLLVLLWVRPFGGSAKFDADVVYAQFGDYEAPGWPNERSEGKPLDSIAIWKVKVDSLFGVKKYAEALPFLQKIAAIAEKDPKAALAQAACYTETNDSARAMQNIIAVEAHATGDLKDQATFYKAKLYIKYKNVEGCRRALQAITGDSWGDKAKALLKALPKQ